MDMLVIVIEDMKLGNLKNVLKKFGVSLKIL